MELHLSQIDPECTAVDESVTINRAILEQLGRTQEALTGGGCPMCTHVAKVAPQYLDSLLYQHYEDYPKRKIGLGICFFSYDIFVIF